MNIVYNKGGQKRLFSYINSSYYLKVLRGNLCRQVFLDGSIGNDYHIEGKDDYIDAGVWAVVSDEELVLMI